ncbi:MAG: hypothetical protein ACK5LP_10315 [Campylobacteraceae bacterium]
MTSDSLRVRLIEKFKYAYTLEEKAKSKNIRVNEPYQGERIGQFIVMSPSKYWYLDSLIPEFNKTPDSKASMEDFSFVKLIKEAVQYIIEETMNKETLKEDGSTSPDNESSVILYANIDNYGILLTGDAGIQALNKTHEYAISQGIILEDTIKFIQIPHHGSRNNVSPSILNKIIGNIGKQQNKTAFVSAGKDSTKHPRRVVVNAFIRRGCRVISTKGSIKRHYSFDMPNREGWIAATSMEFSNKVEKYD